MPFGKSLAEYFAGLGGEGENEDALPRPARVITGFRGPTPEQVLESGDLLYVLEKRKNKYVLCEDARRGKFALNIECKERFVRAGVPASQPAPAWEMYLSSDCTQRQPESLTALLKYPLPIVAALHGDSLGPTLNWQHCFKILSVEEEEVIICQTKRKGNPLDGDPSLITIPLSLPIELADVADDQEDYDLLWNPAKLVNYRLHVVRKISPRINVHSQRAITFRTLLHYHRWLKQKLGGKVPAKRPSLRKKRRASQRKKRIQQHSTGNNNHDDGDADGDGRTGTLPPKVPVRKSLFTSLKKKPQAQSVTVPPAFANEPFQDAGKGMPAPSFADDEGDSNTGYLQPRTGDGELDSDEDYAHVSEDDEETDYTYLEGHLDEEEDYMSQAAILEQLAMLSKGSQAKGKGSASEKVKAVPASPDTRAMSDGDAANASISTPTADELLLDEEAKSILAELEERPEEDC